MSRMRIAALFRLAGGGQAAVAQDGPARAPGFVLRFPPGGTVDSLARLLAAKFTDALRARFTFANKARAFGPTGTGHVAKALDLAEVRRTLNGALGMDLVVSGPEAAQNHRRDERARRGKGVRERNIRPDGVG